MTYPINCIPVSSLANVIAQSLYTYVCSYIPLCDIDLKQTMPYRLLMACIKFCTYIYCIYIGTLFAVLSMLALHIPPAYMQEMSKMSLSKGCPWPLRTWPMEMFPCAQGRVELLWLTIYT